MHLRDTSDQTPRVEAQRDETPGTREDPSQKREYESMAIIAIRLIRAIRSHELIRTVSKVFTKHKYRSVHFGQTCQTGTLPLIGIYCRPLSSPLSPALPQPSSPSPFPRLLPCPPVSKTVITDNSDQNLDLE